MILEKDHFTFKEFGTLCDGGSAYSVSNKICDVPMNNITSNLLYSAGDLIIIKAQAFNEKGWSIESVENTIGVLAQTAPTSAPSNFTESTTPTSVTLNWNA